jgi:hypothetical protein
MAKWVRIRVPDDLLIKFKIHCAKNDISAPKQISDLLKKFLEIQDQKDIGK